MPDLRLDSFEVDDSNRFAVALCKAVVHLEKGYSPLFIHGEKGSGKTHLLSAIKNELALARPEVSLLYISDDFPVERLLSGNKSGGPNGGSQEFIYKEYSRMDVLIADDFERFRNDPKVCHRFYALFDAFVDNEKQVVLASTFPLERLDGFNDRFLSRLRSGIDALVSLPRPETMLKILKRECDRIGMRLEVDILKLLMTEAAGDILYLKKLPSHLKTFTTLTRQPLNKEKVEEFLSVVREEAGDDKGSATTEQIYSSWGQSKEGGRQAENLKADYEQVLAEKDAQLLELERKLAEAASELAESLEEKKRAHAPVESIEKELERLRKDNEDAMLGLRIKLEDKEEKFGILREEHDARISEQAREAERLREQVEEFRSENLVLGKSVEDLNDRIAELGAQLKAKSAELAKAVGQRDSTDKERGRLAQELEAARRKPEAEAKEREARISGQAREAEQLREQIEKLRSENLTLGKSIENLNGRIGELKRNMESKALELTKALEQRDSLTRERQNLGAELEASLLKLKAESEGRAAALREKEEQERRWLSGVAAKEDEIRKIRADAEAQAAELRAGIEQAGKQGEQSEKRASEMAARFELELERRRKLEENLASVSSSLEAVKESTGKGRAELLRVISEKETALAASSELESKLRAEINDLQKSIEFERSRVDTTTQRAEELSGRADALEAELNSSKAELEKSRAEGNALSARVTEAMSERDALERRANSLAEQVSLAKKAGKEGAAAILEKDAKIRDLGARAEDLQNALIERERLLAAKDQEASERIKGQEGELKNRAREIDGLGAQLRARDSELQAERKERKRLAAELERITKEFSASKDEKERAMARLAAEVERTNKELGAAEKHTADLLEKLETAETRASSVADELRKAQQNFSKQIEREKIAQAEQERAFAEARSSLEAGLRESGLEIQSLKAEVSRLEDKARQAEELLSAKEKGESEHIAKLREELERRDREFQNISQELQVRNRDLDLSSAHVEKLTDKLSVLEVAISGLNDEKQKAEKRLAEVTTDAGRRLDDSESRLAEARASLEQSEARLSDMSAQLAADRASFAETIERERGEWLGRENDSREAKTALESELRSASDKTAGLETALANAARERDQHAQSLRDSQREISRLSRQVEEKERRAGDLQKTLESMRADFLRKTAEGTEVKERFSSLEAELSAREKALESARRERSELQSAHEKLRAEAENARTQSVALSSEKTAAEKEAATLGEKARMLEARLSDLESDGTRSKEELGARIKQLEQLAAEKDKALDLAETRAREALQAALTTREDEISGLKSEHKKVVDLLKEDVRSGVNELARSRKSFEEELGKERVAAASLKKKLARMESEIERLMAERLAVQPVAEAAPAAAPAEEKKPAEQPEKEEPAVTAEPRAPVRRMQWLHTFEEFKTFDATAFSVSVAEKIARNPAELYNPLCVYGPKGCGKTHILHAIADLSTSEDSALTCEFTSLTSLLHTMQTKPETLDGWLNSIRLFIIDDFEIANVSAEQQLKLHQFLQALAEKRAQIVIAAGAPPIRMGGLQEFLMRFIEGGLLAKLENHPELVAEQAQAAESSIETNFEPAPAPEQNKEAKPEKPAEAPPARAGRDFLDQLLAPDPRLVAANFKGNHVFGDLEEAFRSPNKKWRSKFPLLIIEDDVQRRNHFFNALANRLQGMFTGRVSLLSVSKLAEMLTRAPSFAWSDLLNRLANSHVVLIDDCDSVQKLPPSASGCLSAIMKEITGRDILLMIGMSKRYKKEPLFGNVYKKATRKKL